MKLSKGFTLIELLIVIGVLGILAAGLLAAVDPFEQLKKARDANNRNASVEVLNAMTRYYATHGYLPWQALVGTIATCDNAVFDDVSGSEAGYPHAVVKVAGGANAVTTVNDCITDTLLDDGELKAGFFSGLSTTLYLGSGSKTAVIVCYSPEGKALRNDTVATAWSVNDNGDSVDEGCTEIQKAAGNCMQCFQ